MGTGIISKVQFAKISANGLCSSPSSDKENNEDSKISSGHKYGPPKLLPHIYSVKLNNEDKIVHDVPAEELQRIGKVPSKEIIKLFIRSSAVKQSASSPWIVDKELKVQYSLEDKLADVFINKSKNAPTSQPHKLMELKKKKANKDKKSSIHKHNGSCSPIRLESFGRHPVQISTKSTVEQIQVDSDSEEDAPLSTLKKTPVKKIIDEEETPLATLKKSPNKKTMIKMDTDSED